MKKELLQKKLGKRILELRTNKGWTQADLASACNKDRQSIDRLENGRSNPTIFTLMEIAKGLDVELKEVVDF